MTSLRPIRSFALAALVLTTLLPAGCKAPAASMRSAGVGMSDAAPPPPAGETARDDSEGDESITNTQEAGVDEGGIVKTHGDHLVVLRRGRLFTVRLGDDSLRAVSYVDVTPHPRHAAWYDEMLVHGDSVVVIGYSYRVRATEIGLFRIDDRGHLSWQDTYFLSSNDYYSARNYASRLVDDTLVFYMPHDAYSAGSGAESESEEGGLRVGRWRGGDRRTRKHGDWQRLMQSAELVPSLSGEGTTIHSVVTCDLSAERLGCDARGIRGGWGRSFYVSAQAVYVWTDSDYDSYTYDPADDQAALFRLPLKDGPIGAVKVRGMPIDQFSFRESKDHLEVLVRQYGEGDAMWGPERTAGQLHLLHLPLTELQERGQAASADAYRSLPTPEGDGWAFHNRFVGDALMYGEGNGWGYAGKAPRDTAYAHLYVHRYADAEPRTDEIPLPHGIDRLEPLGSHGLVVGSNGENLHFSSVELRRERSTVASRFVLTGASQGELRSHGFFFKPSSERGGMLGLPVRRWDEPGYSHLFMGSAGILYLGVDDLRLSEMGELSSDPLAGQHDACLVSCTDWYGNARPIFYRGRVFALLGYELVEGQVVDGEMVERRRVDLSSILGGGRLRHAG